MCLVHADAPRILDIRSLDSRRRLFALPSCLAGAFCNLDLWLRRRVLLKASVGRQGKVGRFGRDVEMQRRMRGRDIGRTPMIDIESRIVSVLVPGID
jgi:hypothetical protein